MFIAAQKEVTRVEASLDENAKTISILFALDTICSGKKIAHIFITEL